MISFQTNTGAILLIVLIMMVTVSLLGATLVSLYFNVLSSGQIELYRAQALYLAEAGLAQAVSALKSQAGSASSSELKKIISATPLGEGTYEAYNDLSQSTIVAMGQSHDVKRSVQLKYGAF